jgi:hypothetical protein
LKSRSITLGFLQGLVRSSSLEHRLQIIVAHILKRPGWELDPTGVLGLAQLPVLLRPRALEQEDQQRVRVFLDGRTKQLSWQMSRGSKR